MRARLDSYQLIDFIADNKADVEESGLRDGVLFHEIPDSKREVT